MAPTKLDAADGDDASVDTWLPSATEPDWGIAGAVFARLLLTWRQWVHRRMEAIHFVDQSVARRHISIDFTIPELPPVVRSADGPMLFLPLTRLRKRTLTNFDLVDETGRTLPMLARDQHRLLVTEALKSVVEETIGKRRAATLQGACEDVVTHRPRDAKDSLQRLLATDWSRRRKDPTRAEHLLELIQSLAESFIVTVPLGADAGRRRVLKFSYDEIVGDPGLPLPEEFRRGFAWRSKPIWFPVYAMRDVPSYHLEVEAPPGLWITRRELVVTDDPSHQKRRSGPFARARFYHRPTENCLGIATIYLRPQTTTIVRASAITAWLAVALLLAFFVALWLGGFHANDSTAPALLLFLPGALSTLLLRPGEHALTTDMLRLLRAVTAAPGVLAFAGGAAFAALPHRSDALIVVFGALAAASYGFAAILTLAWRLCAFPSDPDRSEPREAHTIDE
jgi:hypothetical protein